MIFNESYTLHNGVQIPKLGLGTFTITDKDQIINTVMHALEYGYRHIDTAKAYYNETSIGKAIKRSDVSREDIFLVSKVSSADLGYDSTLKAFEDSLTRLDTNYLDLYLIHWPKHNKIIDTWKAMEYLYNKGKVRAIGVCNFKSHHIEDLITNANIVPMVNQVECHVRLQQPQLMDLCSKYKIQFEAYAPLMKGQIFNINLLQQLAKKYNKPVSSIALRFLIQKNIVIIPKTVKPERLLENASIFDFTLSSEDMQLILNLNSNTRVYSDPDDKYYK